MAALKKIPLRYRISIGVIVLTLILWLLSLGHFEHYFKFIHTQIRFADGVAAWVGPNPHNYTYAMWRPFVTSIMMAILIVIHPLLRTPGGVFILAVSLNFVTCGMAFGNPFTALCVFAFDIALFMLGVE